jgi:thiamine monophosphate synthase
MIGHQAIGVYCEFVRSGFYRKRIDQPGCQRWILENGAPLVATSGYEIPTLAQVVCCGAANICVPKFHAVTPSAGLKAAATKSRSRAHLKVAATKPSA